MGSCQEYVVAMLQQELNLSDRRQAQLGPQHAGMPLIQAASSLSNLHETCKEYVAAESERGSLIQFSTCNCWKASTRASCSISIFVGVEIGTSCSQL